MNLGEFVISFLNPDYEGMKEMDSITLKDAMEIFASEL
jgi:hypothetical protein